MNDHEISEDHQTAICLMAACGWTHKRVGVYHEFWRKGRSLYGYDVARRTHKNLSTAWALRHCGHQELDRRIEIVRREWLKKFLPHTILDVS